MTGMLDFVVQYCLFCYWKSIDIDDTILCCCIFNHFTFYTFHISLEWWHMVHSNAQSAHGPQYLCVGVFYSYPPEDTGTKATTQLPQRNPDSKVRGANMGPIWGRQDPGGPHVGRSNLAIWKDTFTTVEIQIWLSDLILGINPVRIFCAWSIWVEVIRYFWNTTEISSLSIDIRITAWTKLGTHANKARED